MNQCEYVVNNMAGEVDGLAQKNGTTPNEVLHSRLRDAVPTSGHLSSDDDVLHQVCIAQSQ